MNETLLTILIVVAIMIPVVILIQFATSVATVEWEKGMKMKEAEEEENAIHFTLNPDMTMSPGRPVMTRENMGMNGTLGPYGITKDGTPIFDAQIYTKEDIESIQGGYGKGYGIRQYPWEINTSEPQTVIINTDDGPCDEPGICGVEGPVGCSGNPNPPSEADFDNYKRGTFTSRQGDIMIGSCYSPGNMAVMNADPKDVTLTLNTSNGTVISVFGNGTIIKPIDGKPGS